MIYGNVLSTRDTGYIVYKATSMYLFVVRYTVMALATERISYIGDKPISFSLRRSRSISSGTRSIRDVAVMKQPLLDFDRLTSFNLSEISFMSMVRAS
jgi:hypothetical protein